MNVGQTLLKESETDGFPHVPPVLDARSSNDQAIEAGARILDPSSRRNSVASAFP